MKISKILVAALAIICLGQTVNAATTHPTADTTKKSKMKMAKMSSKMDDGKMSAGKMDKMSDGKMDKMSNKKMSPKMKKDSGKMSKM